LLRDLAEIEGDAARSDLILRVIGTIEESGVSGIR
jgi:hypothetical protein